MRQCRIKRYGYTTIHMKPIPIPTIYRLQTRHRIYIQDGKGTRPKNAQIKGKQEELPQAYKDFAEQRKKHPWRTFFAPGGNPYETPTGILGTYALYFLPMIILGIGIGILNVLIARQDAQKGKKKNDNKDDSDE